jgi:hypothetical protein
MHSSPGMSRILFSLLFLRVLAAPIALQPSTFKPPSNVSFIVRVCAWPAQRPQRVTTVSLLVPSSRGQRQAIKADRLPASSACTVGSLGRAGLAGLIALSYFDIIAFRPIDGLRC